MNEWLAIWHRVTALLRRRRLERDLDDELAFHVAMREADYRHDGVPQADAQHAARRRLGNVASLEEQCRDMWTFHPLETLWQDVRCPPFSVFHSVVMQAFRALCFCT